MQEDLNRLVDWAIRWHIKFNGYKCAVMHIVHNNMQHNNTMANQQLIATEEQRNLGITITKDLKWQKQTKKSCKTANRVLGFIAHNFTYKSTELMLPLYKSLQVQGTASTPTQQVQVCTFLTSCQLFNALCSVWDTHKCASQVPRPFR